MAEQYKKNRWKDKEMRRRRDRKNKQPSKRGCGQSEHGRGCQIIQVQLPDTTDSESIVTVNIDPEDCLCTVCNTDDDGKWVQCDKLNSRLHCKHVNLQTDACIDSVEWLCSNCQILLCLT